MVLGLAKRVQAILRDQRGLETLEWIIMAAMIVLLVTIVVYPGGLPEGVNNAITMVTTQM